MRWGQLMGLLQGRKFELTRLPADGPASFIDICGQIEA